MQTVKVGIHEDVGEELIEWFDDVAGARGGPSVGARCLVLPVPAGWGRTSVLTQFVKQVNALAGPSVFAGVLDCAGAPDGLLLQASWLTTVLKDAKSTNPVSSLVGAETPRELFNRGVGLGDALGLLGGRSASIAAFVVSLGIDVLGYREQSDDSRGLTEVGRFAFRVARFSAQQFPVVLAIDNAEALDSRLLDRFVTNLLEPLSSHVLVVATCDASHENYRALLRSGRFGTASSRIHRVDVDGSMNSDRRYALIESETTGWASEAVEQLTERTTTFGQIFKVLAARGANGVVQSSEPVAMVDRLIDATLPRQLASTRSAIVGWGGGMLHQAALQRISDSLGLVEESETWDTVLSGRVVRLAHTKLSGAVSLADVLLSSAERRRISDLLVEVAAQLVLSINDPLEVNALLQPIWILADRGELPITLSTAGLLSVLARIRYTLGDSSYARRVAEHVASWSVSNSRPIEADLLRLLDETGSDSASDQPADSIVGLEARIVYVAALLRAPGRHAQAVAATGDLLEELDSIAESAVIDEWRLLLAHRLILSGQSAIAARAAGPLLGRAQDDVYRQRAELVMYSAGESGELLLIRAAFQERYEQLADDATIDQCHEVIDALTDIASRLGDWRSALDFATQLLSLHQTLLSADHPDVLSTRSHIAFCTGQCGDTHEALRLFTELLPDRIRVLHADHPDVLTTRNNIAFWTRKCENTTNQ